MERCPGYDRTQALNACPWLEVQATRTDALEKAQDSQAEAIVRLDKKLDSIKNWIMGSALSALLALVAGIFNLLRR